MIHFIHHFFDRDTGKVFFASATGITAAIQNVSQLAKDFIPILSAGYVAMKIIFMLADRFRKKGRKK